MQRVDQVCFQRESERMLAGIRQHQWLQKVVLSGPLAGGITTRSATPVCLTVKETDDPAPSQDETR